ncbi:2-dehydropantoate 2-reductase [Phyllobacterium sp. 0TCS1.6C]|uniref:2-dehydropantoate 2-reductase n=1 Tax=unclassified Phyllobacterium TaxID=2638441 RepID=UPI0022648ECF|nr:MULTISPECIES: 2-dehydropantoate 2-reductase [unclassified Phyllobacterium]MCX8281801.1 2-dehydropantoate 2-reductase [Phyllobacterium sp. 0TCS1.6C]MCX8295336.1 2-dehydropantoate 2-reductase [Phyllobacterium sp. 0TCS1.6A]
MEKNTVIDRDARIVIAGAGSIGCYAGGCLAAAGRNVAFLARPRTEAALRSNGLHVIDLGDAEHVLDGDSLSLDSSPATILATADIILLAVKSGATAELAELIARHAPPHCIVVSLQNGVGNAEILRAALGPHGPVVPGMVPFNVVQTEDGQGRISVRRTMPGTVLIGTDVDGLASFLSVPGFSVATHPDMRCVQWSKLLMNLNNALNALSDLPLAQQLTDRSWRKLAADQMSEGLRIMRANGIAPITIQGAPPTVLPWLLRLPDALFRIVARRMLAIDPHARSSMWQDLANGRATEIDYLQGTIIDLAKASNMAAPLAARISACIKAAEGKPVRPHTVDEIRNGR